jgi:hypothetical protein
MGDCENMKHVLTIVLVAVLLSSMLAIVATPSVQAGQTYVVEPQGGETWYTGETHLIKWWGYAWYPYVDTQIDLYKAMDDGTNVYITEIYRTTSTVIGEYYWTIPWTIEPGQYYIQAQINDGHEPMPEQSGVFTISEGDNSAPVISGFISGQIIKSMKETPFIGASFFDGGSGVDTSSVRVTINGIDVTANAIITSTGVQYPTAMLPAGPGAKDVPKGHYTITVQVSDMVGNTATVSWDIQLTGLAYKK